MKKDLEKLTRSNIWELKPYSSAREQYIGEDFVFMDANENPYGKTMNRYPDPLQRDLKKMLAEKENLLEDQVFIGNGSDEIFDLLVRAFCSPGKDNIVVMEPSYGMYEVMSKVNEVEVRKAALGEEFELQSEKVLNEVDEHTKIIVICSPNNPSGNMIDPEKIRYILDAFSGLVVLDEAYIEFAGQKGFVEELSVHPSLLILQTMSKAWGMAGVRIGKAFADVRILRVLNKIKYPYNVSRLNIRAAMKWLKKERTVQRRVRMIILQREWLARQLESFSFFQKVYPSQANFLLLKVDDPADLIQFLRQRRIIIRDRSNLKGCEQCIRISIGTARQNKQLVKALKIYERRML